MLLSYQFEILRGWVCLQCLQGEPVLEPVVKLNPVPPEHEVEVCAEDNGGSV